MRKSVVKIIAAVSGAAILLAGCTKGTKEEQAVLDPDNPVSIEIWHYYNGPQKLAFDSLVTRFNETMGQEQGIVVEAFGQGNVNELYEKVHDAVDKKVGAGEVPTIFAAYTDTVYDLDKRGLVADLGGYFTEEELAGYVDAYIEEGRLGEAEGLKIIPIAKATEIMMINKTDWDKFAAATGTSMTELETIEGVVKTSESYYNWTDGETPDIPGDGKAMFGRDAMANYIILGYYQLTGNSLFTHEGGTIAFEPDEEAFRKLWDNYYIPYINGWFGAYGRFRSDDAKTGDLIVLVGSTSGATYFPERVTLEDESSYPIEAAVLPAPCFEGAELSAIQQGAGMAVLSSNPQNDLAAAIFLKWFVEEEQNIDFAISSAYLPVEKAANDMSLIESAEGFEQLPASLKDALSVSVDVVNGYDLYFEKAFSGSADAREIIEYSLSDRAKADREQILTLTEGGMSMEDATAQFATDENFQSWYEGLINAVRVIIDGD